VYGDSRKSQLVSVVIPDEVVSTEWAKSRNKQHRGFADLVKDPELTRTILDDMARVGKEAKLNGFEFVKAVYLDSEIWSTDNDLLTATMKIKRSDMKAKYQRQLDQLYLELEKTQKGTNE